MKKPMPLVVAVAALSVVSCHRGGSSGKPPCTQCPNVSGVYAETVPSLPDGELPGCTGITVNGYTEPVSVQQPGQGPNLLITTALSSNPDGTPGPFTATLYDDLTISTDSVPVMVGNAVMNFDISLTGSFQTTDGVITGFQGSYLVSSDACQGNLSSTWAVSSSTP
jgi:hypothetical protein